MADENKPDKKNKLNIKRDKKISMRDTAAKSRNANTKTKRVRRAATAASKPVSKVGRALTKELHVIEPKKKNFFTKSRSLTPRYIKNSFIELKRVTWPGFKETWRLVFAVFVFAIALGTFISLLDFGLEKLLKVIIF